MWNWIFIYHDIVVAIVPIYNDAPALRNGSRMLLAHRAWHEYLCICVYFCRNTIGLCVELQKRPETATQEENPRSRDQGMCHGQVRINSKRLPLDTRTHRPIFLKIRTFLLSCMTGSSICHFTRIAALSWLRQRENNLEEGTCSFDMCWGQISHQSLTSPANAVSQFGSNCNTLSRTSQPWLVQFAFVHTMTKAGVNLATDVCD